MKRYDSYGLLRLSLVVFLLPSTPFWTSLLLPADSFPTPVKSTSASFHPEEGQREKAGCSSRVFVDEVCEWLNRQPDVSHRSVEFPPCVLTAFPSITTAGSTLIELERKRINSTDCSETKDNDTKTIALHLIPTPTRLEECLPPKFQKDTTDYFNRKKEENRNDTQYSKVIHLHQDKWNSKRPIVRHRLMAQLGLGVHDPKGTIEKQYSKHDGGRTTTGIRRIFARKTKVRRISAAIAMKFLEEHHLWSATKAKHNYGLFANSNDTNDGELVAVATFSTRRKVVRLGKPRRSHELLRFCSKRDTNVVGGISKLIKAFIKEKKPDDIVTVIDRDWGSGSGWSSLGFENVATMEPIVMVARRFDEGRTSRRHLVGAGIKSADITMENNTVSLNKNDRLGLPTDILQELDALDSVGDVLETLSNYDFFPIYDTGVERLMKTMSYDKNGNLIGAKRASITDLWQNSQPTYAKEYYSSNVGIAALLKHTSSTPSALSQLVANTLMDR